ncbi:MAG: hypothetical protein ACMUIG_03915 [Thermoplasmatota archaeon]
MTKNGVNGKTKNGVKPPNMEDVVSYFSGRGHPHPIANEVENLRQMMISWGFDEIQTSHFMELEDVKKLTGPLYTVFKDSIYHLSWYRLQPIPPEPAIEVKITSRFPGLDLAELWNLIDTIDDDSSGEELLKLFSRELDLSYEDAINLINILPNIDGVNPIPSTQTMRAFMPTAWISNIEATYDIENLPVRIFTVAQLFRREPYLDSRHIGTYHVLSLAIVDQELTMKKGKAIANRIFDNLDLSNTDMVEKTYPFPYFEPGTELEIFGGDLELGTCGMISHNILEERNIDASAFIMDLGIERMLMYKSGYRDIRSLIFPQFHASWNLSDSDISQAIKYKRKPGTDFGKEIASAIYKTYKDNRDNADIKRKVAWSGYLVDTRYGQMLITEDEYDSKKGEGTYAEVVLKEAKTGMGLSGPGAFNQIFVKDGDILGVNPSETKVIDDSESIQTKITYAKAFSYLAAWKIEKALERGHTAKTIEMIRDLEDINLKIDSKALHYMLSHGKKADIRGPVYLKFIFRAKE